MDDDIDYNELFGVSQEGGGAEPAGDGSELKGAPREPSEAGRGGGGGARERAELSPEGEAEQSGLCDDDVPDSDTTGQEGPDVQGTVPDSDISRQEPPDGQAAGPGQGADQARAQYEAVIARAQADAQRAIDEAFKTSGLKNPYTGQPITSKAEYDAYKERFDAERREQLMRGAGMSGEEFDRFVQDLPEVRRAREAQEAAERAQREAREAAARVKLDEQLREISAIDPSVRSLADLAKMPTYPRFYELVQRGNTLPDAFRLANFDALAQRSAAGARQAAVNAARSKEHLGQTRTRGTGAVSVPADVREQYKLFNPDATDEEIQKHYQKSHKEG